MTELILLWSKHSKACAQLGKFMGARKFQWISLCIDPVDVKEWCEQKGLSSVPTLIVNGPQKVTVRVGYDSCTNFLNSMQPRPRTRLPRPTKTHFVSTHGEQSLPSKSPPKTGGKKHEVLDTLESNHTDPSEALHQGKTPDEINRERLQQQEDASSTDGGFKKRVEAELQQQHQTAGLVQKKAKEHAGTGDIVSRALQMQKQREAIQ